MPCRSFPPLARGQTAAKGRLSLSSWSCGWSLAAAAGVHRGDVLLVRFLEIVVLPHDNRLAAHAVQELLDFGPLALVVDLLRDNVPDVLERLHRYRLERLELDDLVAAGDLEGLRDVAG